VFSSYYDVDVMPAAKAVIENGEQAIGIGRKIHPDNIGFLVNDVIEEAGVLVGKTIMILLPDM